MRDGLKDFPENPIDFTLDPVLPFENKALLRLIILAQDPTIEKTQQRSKVHYTLNLEKGRGALKLYIESICHGIGIELDNIYATNLFKYFYTTPPSKTYDVLRAHFMPNMALLKAELAGKEPSAIITLGEPVLKLLMGDHAKLRNYWNYTGNGFTYISRSISPLGLPIFPFPHQPSLRKHFYKETFPSYLAYLKSTINWTP